MITLQDLYDYEILLKNLTEEQLETADKFWNSLWAVYVRNKGTTSSIYWLEQFGEPRAFNVVLLVLKDWINSVAIPARNWAEVSLNEDKLLEEFDQNELVAYRKNNKYGKYVLRHKPSQQADLVKVRGKVQKTGLVRTGFALAANTEFYYDSKALGEHFDGVVQETVKGMAEMRKRYPEIDVDDAAYDVVSETIVTRIMKEPKLYTLGTSYIDSRGRAIKECLSKVANPIGYKCFRALLVIPELED